VEVADWECHWQVFLKKNHFFLNFFNHKGDFTYSVALTFENFLSGVDYTRDFPGGESGHGFP
jgi:hypothetical protein